MKPNFTSFIFRPRIKFIRMNFNESVKMKRSSQKLMLQIKKEIKRSAPSTICFIIKNEGFETIPERHMRSLKPDEKMNWNIIKIFPKVDQVPTNNSLLKYGTPIYS